MKFRNLLVLMIFVAFAAIVLGCAPSPATPAAPAPAATTAPAAAPTTAPAATAAPAQPTKPPAPAITRGGTLRVGLNSDLFTMDPHLSNAAVDRQVYQSIFNPLVRLDKDLTLKPELAESWEFSDPTTLVMHLRKGVKFHDGTDFNAQAVKFNFDRMMNPDTKSLRASEIAAIKDVAVVDDYTIKFTLKSANAPLLAILSDRAGMIISPAAIQKYGKDLARNPVGTGPFKFVEWVTGDHLTVQKFDQYWEKGADGQPLPYLDQIIYKPVTDATVRLTSVKTGTLDMIDQIAPKDYAALKGSKDPIMDEVAGLGWQALELNNAKAPFDKVEARQALNYALDRDSIVKDVLFGTATAGQGPIAPSSWAYDPSVNIYKRDVSKAKDLLTKAGLTAPVKFDCIIVNTPDALLLGQALKEELAQGGFDMNIVPLDFPTALSKQNAKDYTCFQIGWSGRPDPDANFYQFMYSKGSNNVYNYANPKVDDALDKARTTYEQAQRKDLYTQAIKQVNDDGGIGAYLYWPTEIKVWSAKVNGFLHVPDGMIRTKEMWLSK
jgi:peptide/nickel transport system substrate-binding protein